VRNELLIGMFKAGAMVGGITFLILLFFMYANGRYDVSWLVAGSLVAPTIIPARNARGAWLGCVQGCGRCGSCERSELPARQPQPSAMGGGAHECRRSSRKGSSYREGSNEAVEGFGSNHQRWSLSSSATLSCTHKVELEAPWSAR